MRRGPAFAALMLILCGIAIVGSTGATGKQMPTKPILTWPDLLSRPQPKPDTTLPYGADPLQLVDIWRPAGPGLHPAVVMLHGGCWQTSVAERDIMNWIADDLRAAGIGVWNVEYRGVDRGGGYPGTYQDVAAAADLFVARGGEYGLKTSGPRVVIGHSAGGHLALWLARRPALAAADDLHGTDPARFDVAISQGGLPDLRAGATSKGHACGAEAPAAMAGGDYARTSPPEMPLGTAYELLFNNSEDHVTPPSTGQTYVTAMAQRGQRAVMDVTAGEGHVELIAPGSVSWNKQRAAIRKALGLVHP